MDDNKDEKMDWTDADEARFPLRAYWGYGHMWSKPILGRMDAHRRKRVAAYFAVRDAARRSSSDSS